MQSYNIYQDIAERTQGDIYMGVVGPVRTGKSTFIKRFMDLLVIPNITNEYQQERARDELPQSAAGKTIMTTEPKFIPNEAIEITVADNAKLKVRMIDCVGYVVDSALGHIENDAPRMVSTPWFDHDIPFNEAAEIGTKKVITEHSTIGIMITSDGSVTEINRDEYVKSEERVVNELKGINKPFVIILNSAHPTAANTQSLRMELETKYSVPVMAINCVEMNQSDIQNIMEKVLFEFPLREIKFNMPKWIDSLDSTHWLKQSIFNCVISSLDNVNKINDIHKLNSKAEECEYISRCFADTMYPGKGSIVMQINVNEGLFYKVLGEMSGFEIANDGKLIKLMRELSDMKKNYDKIEYALHQVNETGYGIVCPTIDDLTLEEPEMFKQGGRFGVRLKASAPSIHMIRADIETEVSPVVGSEKQSQELVNYLLEEFEVDPKKIWESNIFGKSLHELVNEGLHNKLNRMPEDAQSKLRETLQKIINEGSGGLICIIL